MTNQTQRYFDEAGTAAYLRVAKRTLQRWRVTGDGPPFIRAGQRRILYEVASIDAWVEARTFPHHAAEVAKRSAA